MRERERDTTEAHYCARLFMPVEEDFNQNIYVIDKKKDGSIEKQKLYGVRYVPLTDAPLE